MTVVTLTATGAATWTVPGDCPAGTVVAVEAWGAGAGASGRVSTSFGAAGGSGGFSSGNFTVSSADVSAGVPYGVGAGSAGTSGSNPARAADSFWGKNRLSNPQQTGSANALPTDWNIYNNGTLTVAYTTGTDVAGNNAITATITGTSSTTFMDLIICGNATPISASAAYTISGTFKATSTTGVTSFALGWDDYNNATWVASNNTTTIAITGSEQRLTTTYTTHALTNLASAYLQINFLTATTINCVVTISACQMETGSSMTALVINPCILARGGEAPITTTGGIAASTTGARGTTLMRAGAAGGAYNAAGSGGAGGSGKDGIGVAGNTSGQGGQGDATSGGLGGAVKTSSPGNAGTSNVEGGGGGGGMTTVTSGTAGAGGAPGGGGGGAVVSGTALGGTGGRGQIRLTYTPVAVSVPFQRWYQLAPLLAQ